MPGARFTIPTLALVALLAAPAAAADGDLFSRGTRWCASTHPRHGTLEGFGEPLDITRESGGSEGVPLRAPGDGRVRIYSRGWGSGWGNSVIWRSADGREQIHLAHLGSFGETGPVEAGAVIGRIGSTGQSTGAHLHTSRRFRGEPAPLVLMGRRIEAGRCYTSTGPIATYCGGRVATILGTAGADRLRGGAGPDVVAAKGGDDVVVGRAGRDALCGGGGKDVLRGGPGRDRLGGGGGTDRLAGGPGDDVLRGGAGIDEATFAGSARPVRVDLLAAIARGEGADIVRSIPVVIGSAWPDVLSGDGLDNTLFGRAGDDAVDGGEGRDTLHGGKHTDDCVNGEELRACEGPPVEP